MVELTKRGLFNFNSIKVQLKQFDALVDFVFNLFQFHKGTIKTLVPATLK